jgi:hypothetical protein
MHGSARLRFEARGARVRIDWAIALAALAAAAGYSAPGTVRIAR